MNNFTLTRRDVLRGLATLVFAASLIAFFGRALQHKPDVYHWGEKPSWTFLDDREDALFAIAVVALSASGLFWYVSGTRSRRRIVHIALALRRQPHDLPITEATSPTLAARLAMDLTDQIRPIDVLSGVLHRAVETGRAAYLLDQAKAIHAYQMKAAGEWRSSQSDEPQGEACLLNIVAVISVGANLHAPIGHPAITATRAFQSLPNTAPDAIYLFTVPDSGLGMTAEAACRLQTVLSSTVRKI